MDTAGIARRLKERGRELGLGAIGIAALEASDHGAALTRWLASGYAGTMKWMERTAAVRADPKSRFDWARSAIVVAVSYLPYRGERDEQQGALRHVARYAVGRDYHVVLGDRLESLAAFLRAEAPGARTRAYVDTGPLLERELAARAGLGWFGKSTNLIGPRGDSWLLLGQILTDLDLPPDGPVTDHCGTCTACIDACPTGAILEPYVVDSNRCISYLTIELRGSIPLESRPELGDWVFGCDVCQEVCPWNRKVEPTPDAAFRDDGSLKDRDLSDLVRLDEKTFRDRFADSALQRPRRAGLVRNALIVAANTGHGRALDAAGDALSDPEPVIRETAAWALGQEGAGGSRRRAIERSLKGERDPSVRKAMERALDRDR